MGSHASRRVGFRHRDATACGLALRTAGAPGVGPRTGVAPPRLEPGEELGDVRVLVARLAGIAACDVVVPRLAGRDLVAPGHRRRATVDGCRGFAVLAIVSVVTVVGVEPDGVRLVELESGGAGIAIGRVDSIDPEDVGGRSGGRPGGFADRRGRLVRLAGGVALPPRQTPPGPPPPGPPSPSRA